MAHVGIWKVDELVNHINDYASNAIRIAELDSRISEIERTLKRLMHPPIDWVGLVCETLAVFAPLAGVITHLKGKEKMLHELYEVGVEATKAVNHAYHEFSHGLASHGDGKLRGRLPRAAAVYRKKMAGLKSRLHDIGWKEWNAWEQIAKNSGASEREQSYLAATMTLPQLIPEKYGGQAVIMWKPRYWTCEIAYDRIKELIEGEAKHFHNAYGFIIKAISEGSQQIQRLEGARKAQVRMYGRLDRMSLGDAMAYLLGPIEADPRYQAIKRKTASKIWAGKQALAHGA